MKILDPMNDFVFKALFGKEDKTSKMLLVALLNDILLARGEDEIQSVTYLNPFNYKEFDTDKLSILDIKAVTDKGETINIEVQVRAEDNYRKRSLYYWSKAYGESIQEAETYDSLKKTIVINIMGYNAINESENLHTTFKVLEENEHFILLEDLQIHYLELPKLPNKKVDDLQGVELWLSFLKEAPKESNEIILKELRGRSEAMSTAIDKLQEISADDRMRELQRAREKSRLDMISRVKYAEKQAEERGMKRGLERGLERGMERGMERGLDQGRMEKAKELVKNGIAKGYSVEILKDITGLTEEDIEDVRLEILQE